MESLTRHTDYGSIGLDEGSLAANPLDQLAQWLTVAEAEDIFEPNAMVLSTIDPDGRPSSRTVLLKGLDSDGLEFVTNYSSRKGRALAGNPEVSAVFPWYSLKRQVLIYGRASQTSDEVSDAYFDRRPHGAKLASMASEQSQPAQSRDELDRRLAALQEQYPEGSVVPRPRNWGGFRIVPHAIEFWQGRSMRFHDRLRYDKDGQGHWHVTRLQP